MNKGNNREKGQWQRSPARDKAAQADNCPAFGEGQEASFEGVSDDV